MGSRLNKNVHLLFLRAAAIGAAAYSFNVGDSRAFAEALGANLTVKCENGPRNGFHAVDLEIKNGALTNLKITGFFRLKSPFEGQKLWTDAVFTADPTDSRCTINPNDQRLLFCYAKGILQLSSWNGVLPGKTLATEQIAFRLRRVVEHDWNGGSPSDTIYTQLTFRGSDNNNYETEDHPGDYPSRACHVTTH